MPPHRDLTTLADAADPDGGPRSRIVVAKLGRFQSKRYGRFSIGTDDLDGWKRNLTGQFGGRVPIDLDHSPERGRGSEAAGWITGLERDGDRVMADVEWTPLGEAAIRERRYLYVSPTFTSSYKGEDGGDLGRALIGAGLTNRPFLREGMPTLSLSADLDDDVTAADDGPACDCATRPCACPGGRVGCGHDHRTTLDRVAGQLVALGWNEHLHPRGFNGRFVDALGGSKMGRDSGERTPGGMLKMPNIHGDSSGAMPADLEDRVNKGGTGGHLLGQIPPSAPTYRHNERWHAKLAVHADNLRREHAIAQNRGQTAKAHRLRQQSEEATFAADRKFSEVARDSRARKIVAKHLGGSSTPRRSPGGGRISDGDGQFIAGRFATGNPQLAKASRGEPYDLDALRSEVHSLEQARDYDPGGDPDFNSEVTLLARWVRQVGSDRLN